MHKKVVCVRTYFVWCYAKEEEEEKKKNTNKIRQFSGTYISESTGAISFKFLCNVMYMVGLKYVNLKEIHPIVFKLQ